jgi:hypothetical protein
MRKCIAIPFIIALPILFLSCHRLSEGGKESSSSRKDSIVNHWINWNLAFSPTSASDSVNIILNFEKYLNHWADSINPSAKLTFSFQYCPCDSFITNMDATLLYGSGNPVPPPPNKPNPGPSGDYLLGNNFEMHIPAYEDSNYVNVNPKEDSVKISYAASAELFNKTLAVIDTGLDTALFNKAYPKTIWNGDLLWQDGPSTLFDVVIGEPEHVLVDNGSVKHGTAATSVVLSQLIRARPKRIPKIMSIRAFDDSERGSIYTVTCALSYAIQHHVDFINASWGYYGQGDSILKKYLVKADSAHIRIIAAAGNTRGKHDPAQICSASVNDNNNIELFKKDTLFYPACFAPDIANLVSVTEIHAVPVSTNASKKIPCFYQNFSPKYITVGAFEELHKTSICCAFSIPFLSEPIEGSSFATPVITAILIHDLTQGQDIKNYIINNALTATAPFGTPNTFYTNEGKYFPFVLK